MKKYLNLFIVSLFIFSISSVAFAFQGTPLTNMVQERETVRQEIQVMKTNIQTATVQEREQIRAKIMDLRETAKQNMLQLREQVKIEKDAIKAKTQEGRLLGREIALERFDKAVERITALTEKVNALIIKYETDGVDATEAKDLIAAADLKMTEAKSKIAEAADILSTSTNQLTTENKTALRTLKNEAQTLVKGAHLDLIKAIKSLKTVVLNNQTEDDDEDTETES
ncbi:MAG: hypothetical protein ABH951_01800 [Patescibacteria group bacterium]